MSHYTIGYHDLQNNHYEICEYAPDAYTAIKQAREDLPDMKASPLSCEYCLKEDDERQIRQGCNDQQTYAT